MYMVVTRLKVSVQLYTALKTRKKQNDKFCYWIFFSMTKSDTKMFKNIFFDKKPGCGRQGAHQQSSQNEGKNFFWRNFFEVDFFFVYRALKVF